MMSPALNEDVCDDTDGRIGLSLRTPDSSEKGVVYMLALCLFTNSLLVQVLEGRAPAAVCHPSASFRVPQRRDVSFNPEYEVDPK